MLFYVVLHVMLCHIILNSPAVINRDNSRSICWLKRAFYIKSNQCSSPFSCSTQSTLPYEISIASIMVDSVQLIYVLIMIIHKLMNRIKCFLAWTEEYRYYYCLTDQMILSDMKIKINVNFVFHPPTGLLYRRHVGTVGKPRILIMAEFHLAVCIVARLTGELKYNRAIGNVISNTCTFPIIRLLM